MHQAAFGPKQPVVTQRDFGSKFVGQVSMSVIPATALNDWITDVYVMGLSPIAYEAGFALQAA